MEVVEPYKLVFPSNIVITGASNSGKSHLGLQILINSEKLFEPPIRNRFYMYKYYQKEFDKFHDSINFITSLDQIPEQSDPALVLIDDFLGSLDKSIAELFIAGRHRNLNPIFLSQALFHPSPIVRTINANTHHFVFMKSPRSTAHLDTLGRQFFPHKRKEVLRIFEEATKEKFSYFWVNLHPQAPEYYRFTSNVLQEFPTVYK